MEAKVFSESLISKMESEFSKINERDALKATTIKITILKITLAELKEFILNYEFESETEEMTFFKTVKPPFLSQFLYYSRLQRLQLLMIASSRDNRVKHLERELDEINEYLLENRDLHLYMISQSSDLDRTYFLRSSAQLKDVNLDVRFATAMDGIVAGIEARMMLKEDLSALLTQTMNPFNRTYSRLEWSRSKTDLVELVYALHASKVFGNDVGIKDIVSMLESLIVCDLSQYSRVFLEIRQRKKGRTTFLDAMKDRLLERIELIET